MYIEVDDVAELRRLAQTGELPKVLPAPPTLLAAAEIACSAWWWKTHVTSAFAYFQGWCRAHEVLDRSWTALNGERPCDVGYDARRAEVCSLTNYQVDLVQFSNRFRKSLTDLVGVSADIARGLAGALGEMVDNAFEHSSNNEGVTAPALMAYEVEETRFCFLVCDVGRGTLESLRCSPQWSELCSAEDALTAIVSKRASRRSEQGTGFASMVRVLAEEGTMRIRSGDAQITINATGARQLIAISSSFQLVGTQTSLSATLALTGAQI